MRLFTIAASALLVVAIAPACLVETKTCTLVGCESTVHVAYAKPIAGSYALDVRTEGLAASGVACPTQPTVVSGSGGVLVQCDAAGFTLSSANAFGATRSSSRRQLMASARISTSACSDARIAMKCRHAR